MKIDWKLLSTPEHKKRTNRWVAVKGAESIMSNVPSAVNPCYELGCVLENLKVIEELNIVDEEIDKLKYAPVGSSVSTDVLAYVTSKLKEAQALIDKEHEVKHE